MKKIKQKIQYGCLAISSAILMTSCSGWLDLKPIDDHGSESYWKTEAHVSGYMDGMHKHLRDAAFQHVMTFGELRGGHYVTTTSADGMGVSDGPILLQNFTEVNTGVSKFGDLFGRIANVNLFIDRVTNATYVSEDKKNFYLGQAYGLRAFYYYDLYRVYGGVPLRLTPDVIDGIIDPNLLYMHRSTPKEVMAQIKKDLEMSMDYFGDVSSFDPYKKGNKVYWSKAATEALMGDVYLWTSKVTTKWEPASGTDLADEVNLEVAKKALENVMNNYSLSLQPTFAKIFDTENKANSEVIFAVRYHEGEATNGNSTYLYNLATGTTQNRYKADGTVFGDPLGVQTSANQSREYDKAVYLQFDEEDTRRDETFIVSYVKDEDTGDLSLYGTHVQKNIGHINSQGTRVYDGDYVYYRLPWVYLSLAEIANMQGDNGAVENYINKVRERAYGKSWDPAKYGFTAGDFTKNELAILAEKDKEFIQEGQRWWDLRRMTLTKGGKPLVFTLEGDLKGVKPILDEATEAHKVLWPIELGMLNNDPKLTQTPGY